MRLELKSQSPEHTQAIGCAIGDVLHKGDVVALVGALGSGKTTLVQGLARGLGVREKRAVHSPTFALIHEYEGRIPIFHLDWYRLDAVRGVDEALSAECFTNRAVAVIEWADRGKALLPKEYLLIEMQHESASARKLSIDAPVPRYEKVMHALAGL